MESSEPILSLEVAESLLIAVITLFRLAHLWDDIPWIRLATVVSLSFFRRVIASLAAFDSPKICTLFRLSLVLQYGHLLDFDSPLARRSSPHR